MIFFPTLNTLSPPILSLWHFGSKQSYRVSLKAVSVLWWFCLGRYPLSSMAGAFLTSACVLHGTVLALVGEIGGLPQLDSLFGFSVETPIPELFLVPICQ